MLEEMIGVRCHGHFYFPLLFLMLAFLVACENQPAPQASALTLRDCRVPVHYRAPGTMDHVAVVGDFNEWDPGAHPLKDLDGDGDYFGLLDLPAGSYHYAIWVDGYTFRDLSNSLTHFSDEGEEHSFVVVESCDNPKWKMQTLKTSSQGELTGEFQYLASKRSGKLNEESLTLLLNGENYSNVEFTFENQIAFLEVSDLPPGRYTLSLESTDEYGEATKPWSSVVWVEEKPFSWRDALIYQVVVDRFYNPESALDTNVPISYYRGGKLAGITEKLNAGYFDELGVNALWLSPLHENADETYVGRDSYSAQAYHGYWPRSAREVEERFGGAEELESLVEAAHARGIRVIMDYVLNHVHTDHPYFQNPHWFNGVDKDCICGITCPWGENMLTCWFDPFLADLNWKNPEVVEQLTNDALYWVQRFKLDGLRLDAIPMMPRLATRHMRRKLREVIDQSNQHTYLLGETYTGSSGHGQIRHYLGEDGLSGQFEFPTMWTLRAALGGRESMKALHAQVVRSEEAWRGSGSVMAPIIGNHDVPRIISDLQGDELWSPRTEPAREIDDSATYGLLKLAWTFLMTQPGAPVIYYGDELGMPGANDPDNRRNMRFDNELQGSEKDVLSHVQKLGKLRSCSDVIRLGQSSLEYVDDELYVYKKTLEEQEAWIYLNRSQNVRRTRYHPLSDLGWYPALQQTPKLEGDLMVLEPRSSLILVNDLTCLETGL
ncbi:MAG: hypothetical protein HOI23_22325 [Deltaproteobacteria bacterium]|nr:hypothetical protein [Deltaproteobacteria bacterium]MBT6431638.1 hypothetical protein [Deltaproteobacteria bacterium]MBT6490299.1 hypothetical protein [Deltaproteobacteria bacterium]